MQRVKDSYNVSLIIHITNNIGDLCQHPIHETFENAGINDEKVEKIVLFPNPAGDFIQLEIKDNIKIQKYQIVNSHRRARKRKHLFGKQYFHL